MTLIVMGAIAAGCLVVSLALAAGIRDGWLIADRGRPIHEGASMAEVREAERLAAATPHLDPDDTPAGPNGPPAELVSLSAFGARRPGRCPTCEQPTDLHCELHSPRCCPGTCIGVADDGPLEVTAHHPIGDDPPPPPRAARRRARPRPVVDDISRAASGALRPPTHLEGHA